MPNELEKKIVRFLQDGFPLVSRPYLVLAEKIGLTEAELMEKLKEMIERGLIRRFGAAVKHQELGFTANAMVVWDVPEARIMPVGEAMAQFDEVTHCYQRPRRPGWPYNIFTVVHGRTRAECSTLVGEIAQRVGIDNYKMIYSTRELKKSSMKYFLD